MLLLLCILTYIYIIFGYIVIENAQDVHRRASSTALKVSISPELRTVSLNACIYVNTTACYCDDYFRVDIEDVSFPRACRPPEAFWFSLRLFFEGDAEGKYVSTTPMYVDERASGEVTEKSLDQLTLVLLLTLEDVPRALLLLESLALQDRVVTGEPLVSEMIVVTPDTQLLRIVDAIKVLAERLAFPIRVMAETRLLLDPGNDAKIHVSYTYGLQMALKLLVASRVRTRFYVTLDADIILLRPLVLRDLLVENSDDFPGRRAIYEPEPRVVHAQWWRDSASLLGYLGEEAGSSTFDPTGPGFSVTPALLSTYGSLLVVDALQRRYGPGFKQKWLGEFGTVSGTGWSEYTLYRLTLDHEGIFNILHTPEDVSPKLHCHDVWYEDQLPWDARAAAASGCLFSVVQSSTGADIQTLRTSLRNVRHTQNQDEL